jgi:hypothetical protein
MDWPHDPDGEEGSEGRRKYGHAVLAKKVDDEDFPITAEWYVEQFGDHPVRLDSEQSSPSGHLRGSTRRSRGLRRVHRAVGRAMRANDLWFYEGSETFA